MATKRQVDELWKKVEIQEKKYRKALKTFHKMESEYKTAKWWKEHQYTGERKKIKGDKEW